MIKYPLTYNPIRDYYEKICSGEVTVCNKLRLTYRKIISDIENTSSEYFYSSKRANHILEFAENFAGKVKVNMAANL